MSLAAIVRSARTSRPVGEEAAWQMSDADPEPSPVRGNVGTMVEAHVTLPHPTRPPAVRQSASGDTESCSSNEPHLSPLQTLSAGGWISQNRVNTSVGVSFSATFPLPGRNQSNNARDKPSPMVDKSKTNLIMLGAIVPNKR